MSQARKSAETSSCSFAAEQEEEEFFIQSQKTLNEILSPEIDGLGILGANVIHPEKCAWLEGLSKRMAQGDLATMFVCIQEFHTGYGIVLAKCEETACANYAAYILHQGIIVNVLVQGLREMAATKKCYLLPRNGRKTDGRLRLVSMISTYSEVLSMLAADKRNRKFLLAQFTDLLALQLKNYNAAAMPLELKAGCGNVELLSRLMVATSILVLTSGKGLSKKLRSAMLQDAVVASAEVDTRLLDSSITILQENMSFLHLLSLVDVLTVATRVLEGSNDKAAFETALNVILHMLEKEEPSFGNLVQRHGSLLSTLLALALTALQATRS